MNKIKALLLGFLLIPSLSWAATLSGVQYAKRVAVPAQLVSQGTDGGRIKHCTDSYTLTADLSVNDIIKVCRIPEGATVIDVRLTFGAMSGSGAVDIGWNAGASGAESSTQSGFGASVSVSSAGVYSMFTSQSTASGYYHTFAEEVQPIIKIAVDTSATSGTYRIDILYYVE